VLTLTRTTPHPRKKKKQRRRAKYLSSVCVRAACICANLSRWCTSFMAIIWRSLWPPGHAGEPLQRILVTQELLDDLHGFWRPVLANPGAAWLTREQWTCAPLGDGRAVEHHVSSSDASGRWGAGGISEPGRASRGSGRQRRSPCT
jgi:hypothetical protein